MGAGLKGLLLLAISNPADAGGAAGEMAHGEEGLCRETGDEARSCSSREARGTSRRRERTLSPSSVSLVGTDLVIMRRDQIEDVAPLGAGRGGAAKDMIAGCLLRIERLEGTELCEKNEREMDPFETVFVGCYVLIVAVVVAVPD